MKGPGVSNKGGSMHQMKPTAKGTAPDKTQMSAVKRVASGKVDGGGKK